MQKKKNHVIFKNYFIIKIKIILIQNIIYQFKINIYIYMKKSSFLLYNIKFIFFLNKIKN